MHAWGVFSTLVSDISEPRKALRRRQEPTDSIHELMAYWPSMKAMFDALGRMRPNNVSEPFRPVVGKYGSAGDGVSPAAQPGTSSFLADGADSLLLLGRECRQRATVNWEY